MVNNYQEPETVVALPIPSGVIRQLSPLLITVPGPKATTSSILEKGRTRRPKLPVVENSLPCVSSGCTSQLITTELLKCYHVQSMLGWYVPAPGAPMKARLYTRIGSEAMCILIQTGPRCTVKAEGRCGLLHEYNWRDPLAGALVPFLFLDKTFLVVFCFFVRCYPCPCCRQSRNMNPDRIEQQPGSLIRPQSVKGHTDHWIKMDRDRITGRP